MIERFEPPKMIVFPVGVCYIMWLLKRHGFDAFAVGGAVRDILLGREPHDWDIATNAPIEEVMKIFPNSKEVGAAFGVVLVKTDDGEYQVARFRTERGYSDFRHPDEVSFVRDIESDLERRDLTINALAYGWRADSKEGPMELLGPAGALMDLELGIIRAVGDANERFREDPLRMMRAVRFSCQLGFDVSPTIYEAIRKNSVLINNISAERIQEELNKILLTDKAGEGIRFLEEAHLLRRIIPELMPCVNMHQNSYHKYDVFTHTLYTINATPAVLTLRLAALLHDVGKPLSLTWDDHGVRHFYRHDSLGACIAEDVLRRLKYDNKTIEEVTFYVEEHMAMIEISPKGIRRALNRYGLERLKNLLALNEADLIGTGKQDPEDIHNRINNLLNRINQITEENPPVSFDDLAIDGHEIMEILGLEKPCKKVGDIKQLLMNMVVDDPSLNTKERLTDYVREMEGK